MPHHMWGDNDFDWKALQSSISYIMDFWKKYGRIGSHGKEKYGTFRDHPYMFDGTIQSLIWPGYVRIMGNKWFYFNVDTNIIRKVNNITGITKIVRSYQKFIYNMAVQKMCKKYPHIIDEIVSDLDGYEFVRPGIFGKVDGKIIHDKYWRRLQ